MQRKRFVRLNLPGMYYVLCTGMVDRTGLKMKIKVLTSNFNSFHTRIYSNDWNLRAFLAHDQFFEHFSSLKI